MDTAPFDAIVVGARVAGCSLGYQLAQQGWRVALVEQHPVPLGPVLSLPICYPRALERFRRLGLLSVVDATTAGVPRLRTVHLRLNEELTFEGTLPPSAGFEHALVLPRERFDNALLTFVTTSTYPAPGAVTLLSQCRVEHLVRRDGAHGPVTGVRVAATKVKRTGQGPVPARTLSAPLVIGADGRLSRVAALLGSEARPYHMQRPATSFCYTLCHGIDLTGLADITFARARNRRMVMITQVEEGTQAIGVYLPSEQYAPFRGQGHGSVQHMADELRSTWESTRELHGRMDRVVLGGKVLGLDPRYGAGYFRPAGGPGWALVGDAAHFKDPASGQGIHDALYTVEALVATLGCLTDGKPLTAQEAVHVWPQASRELQRCRDAELRPMYDFTNSLSFMLTHPPSRMNAALLRCIAADPARMEELLGVSTGATDVSAFKRELVADVVRRLAGHRGDLLALSHEMRRLFGPVDS